MTRTTKIERCARGLMLLGAVWGATALAGCTVGLRAEGVELDGAMHDGEQPPGTNEVDWLRPSRRGLARHFDNGLAFTASGEPTIHGRLVDLPRTQELRRWGVVLIDVAPLPIAWRPPVAAVTSSTLVVTALDRSSPLAHAGLRVGDAIERVAPSGDDPFVDEPDLPSWRELRGGRPTTVDDLQLAIVRRLTLEVRRADGSLHTVEAEASDALHDVTAWTLPCVVTYAGSTTGTGLTLGPFGLLFAAHDVLLTDERRFVDRTEWGLLLDLFFFQSETDVLTGETFSRFRFFYVFELGDDQYDVRKA